MNNVEIFQTLKTTSSSKERLEFLKSNANDVIKDIFFRAYNDDVYNIKTVEIVQSTRSASLDNISDWNRFVDMLIDLRDRKITGNEARTALSNLLSEFSEEEQQILIGVIQKDLKVGVSRDSFQKIYPIFDIWEVSLAHNLNDVTGVDPIDGTYFASRKLDGCVSGDTMITMADGSRLPIKYIVENNITSGILSFNTKTGKIEKDNIVGYLKNGVDINESENNHQWYEIELEDGRKIRLTGNHRVFLPELNCFRRVDELNGDESFLLIN